MLRSRTFLTTTLGLLGAILGFVLSVMLLVTGALQGRIDWLYRTLGFLLGDSYSGMFVGFGIILVTTLESMFAGFSLAKRLAVSDEAQLPNKPHPLD